MTTPFVVGRPLDRPTRAQLAEAARRRHERRHQIALSIAADHGGVVTWKLLHDAGIPRGQVQVEIDRGVWKRAGRHTLSITGPRPNGVGVYWWALWESGRLSLLDGVTSLLAAGLRGWTHDVVDVSVRRGARVRDIDGIRHHRLTYLGPAVTQGLRRTRPEVAVLWAAQWAATDRQASTLIAMTVQQRLVPAQTLLDRWQTVLYSPRRAVLDVVIRDVCDGAHSLNELDFAALCRERGLPEPTRQAVRTASGGRVYLDVLWEELGVHVEIQGAQHTEGTAMIEDALRFNALRLGEGLVSLQIPVLGLRTMPDLFMDQVAQALRDAARRAA